MQEKNTQQGEPHTTLRAAASPVLPPMACPEGSSKRGLPLLKGDSG